MILNPCCKINLGLRVLGRRPDGYHDLETIFLPCTQFCDTLEVVTGDDFSITAASLGARYSEENGTLSQWISPDGKLMLTVARRDGVDWSLEKDLCTKAYMLLAEDFKLPPAKIFLEKTIPVGAGLGGGSADAAFTLKALSEVCGLNLSPVVLEGYAARLGSDCAFFIRCIPSLGTGRGEILTPLEFNPLEGLELKVIAPEGISVSTAEAYAGVDGVGARQYATTTLTEASGRPVSEWKQLICNDFEPSVFKGHPEIAAIKQSLYGCGAAYASMSGSGSAVYGVFELR